MSNVLLMSPPIDAPVPAKSTPLGLGYLAGVLKKRKHNVKIIDFTLSNKTMCYVDPPDAIGISLMFTQYKAGAMKFVNEIRRIFKHAKIIIGGAHASTFPEECIEFADTVVVGEGEEVICDIIETNRSGIIRTERIRNLDLYTPEWNLMMEDIEEINYLSRKSPFLMRRPLVHIITSRGCPNACTFCAVKVAWGRTWIHRSAQNIVNEIEKLRLLGFKEIHFNDDNCSINRQRMVEICEEILKRKINIKIACPTGIHIATLDRPLLALMKRAGFYRLCFGIETGNQDMQIKIKKNINLDKARRVIKDANELGYWTAATFIHGFTDNVEKEKQENLEFAKTSGLDFPVFYDLQIQPKTEIWNSTRTL